MSGHEKQSIQPELIEQRFGNPEMPDMQRVKGPAVDSDTLSGHFPAPQRSRPG
jgi:hypothetical protein